MPKPTHQYNQQMENHTEKHVECKPELVILALQKFYNSRHDIDKIMPYLLGTAPISLRLIDFFEIEISN